MSATHGTGAIEGIRQGCQSIIHTFRVASIIGYLGDEYVLLKIPGTTLQPKCFRVFAVVGAAFQNTGAATLSVGKTGAGYTDILNAVSLKAATGTTYAGSGTNAFGYTETDVSLHAIITLANADDNLGVAVICVEVWDVNLDDPDLA